MAYKTTIYNTVVKNQWSDEPLWLSALIGDVIISTAEQLGVNHITPSNYPAVAMKAWLQKNEIESTLATTISDVLATLDFTIIHEVSDGRYIVIIIIEVPE